MNENLNLVKILNYCPKGTKLYSPALGEVTFAAINNYDRTYPIIVKTEDGTFCFTKQGKLYDIQQSECLLFPSREQRDWSKFEFEKPKWIPSTEHPAIDEEVIALVGEYNKVTFAHIVDKNKAIDYDGWNIPEVKCWIPCPKIEED